MAEYGVRINFKRAGARVVELGRAHEMRKGTPVFAISDDEQPGADNLLTADQIRANWSAWAGDLFPADTFRRLTVEQAEARGLEIL